MHCICMCMCILYKCKDTKYIKHIHKPSYKQKAHTFYSSQTYTQCCLSPKFLSYLKKALDVVVGC